MSVAQEVQKGLLGCLAADSAVAAIVGAQVYENLPASGTYPCITLGPSDTTRFDREGIRGVRHTMQVDCWVQDGGILNGCRALTDAVAEALHFGAISLPLPYVFEEARVVLVRVFIDPDETTGHGAVSVAIDAEIAWFAPYMAGAQPPTMVGDFAGQVYGVVV